MMCLLCFTFFFFFSYLPPHFEEKLKVKNLNEELVLWNHWLLGLFEKAPGALLVSLLISI